MNYKGNKLKDISGTPQIVNPPRKMLVWNDEDANTRVESVFAIGPSSMDYPVRTISDDGRIGTHCLKHCAEIPKPRRATNREVSKWLAQGNGEVTEGDTVAKPYCKSSLYYDSENSDKLCRDNIKIRKWDDEDWHEPTIDYMGIEEVG